ncbi:MAG: ABC transporter permease subunit [Planctomycetes bacterium]|nr:ABC transporter permease subunit [Planctomycetota bacterium]
MEGSLLLAALASACAVLLILAFLVYFSLPLFRPGAIAGILSGRWQPVGGEFGILPMLAGSLLIASLALAIAFPLALGVCAFVQGLGPPALARPVLAAVHFMTSIPTIVYSFVSVILLVPALRSAFAGRGGFSILTASLVLSVLILPTIVLLVHASWSGLGPSVRMTCAALGLSRTQEIFRVLVPVSSRSLVVAAILALGRALGDTMVSLLLAGNSPQWPSSILDSARTLTAHIAMVLAVDSQSPAYLSIFSSGLILLLVTASLTLAVRWIQSAAGRRRR